VEDAEGKIKTVQAGKLQQDGFCGKMIQILYHVLTAWSRGGWNVTYKIKKSNVIPREVFYNLIWQIIRGLSCGK